MRVIAGQFKGRRLDPVPGDTTRPTSDMVREAIASSVISNRLDGFEGASVLDAFAGSGAVGIEALSRGAGRCTFVDESSKAVSTIEANLRQLPLSAGQTAVTRGDIFEIMGDTAPRHRTLAGAPFDIVFLDPPYAIEYRRVCNLMLALSTQGMLAPSNALVAYEMACRKPHRSKWEKKKDQKTPEDVEHMLELLGPAFSLLTVKRYGNTQLVYLRHELDA